MEILLRLLSRLPRRWLDAFGAFLGWLVWALHVRRGVVMSNLRLAFPEKGEPERREIARRTYRNLGRMITGFLRVPYMAREELERLFVYEGWEAYERARARGKGVVACTGHFGNFDLLAAGQTLRGVPITMITREMGKTGANDLWRAARRRSGVEDLVVRKGETLKAATRALKGGRVLGYVIDQNQSKRHAIFPTFFGVPAATAATPAWLALRTGAAVVFTLSIPLEDGRHKLVVEGPLDVPDTGDRERDVLAFMQDLNDRLERWVRLHPEHWYWLHRRWKTRPDGEVRPPA
ncbi:MAG TPA: lysophospholipid acyltransferase family protein [Anaeromyxobacteraceae bacterium]|nr:lysophospholipid acyltransferase family protein [Anaeromyxobacteraceae bacterium]